MKKLIFIVLYIILLNSPYSQENIYGKYECLLDIFWEGHTRLYLQLDSDSTYKFGYMDDTSFEKTQGSWVYLKDTLLFTPLIIPEKVVIDLKYDRKGKNKYNEFIVVNLNDSSLGKVDFTLFKQNKVFTYSTSNGFLKYTENNLDSIKFKIFNKEFTTYPNKKNNPSWIKIFINHEYKNLLDRLLPNRRLYIINNQIIYKPGKSKSYIFKEVKNIWLFE